MPWATASASPKSARSPSTPPTSSRCAPATAGPAHGPVPPTTSPAHCRPHPHSGLACGWTSLSPLPLHRQTPPTSPVPPTAKPHRGPGRSARSQLSGPRWGEPPNPNPAPVQLRPKFCPFPTPSPLTRPLGPPQSSASTKDLPTKQARHPWSQADLPRAIQAALGRRQPRRSPSPAPPS